MDYRFFRGINQDRAPHSLAEGEFSDMQNMRSLDGSLRKRPGFELTDKLNLGLAQGYWPLLLIDFNIPTIPFDTTTQTPTDDPTPDMPPFVWWNPIHPLPNLPPDDPIVEIPPDDPEPICLNISLDIDSISQDNAFTLTITAVNQKTGAIDTGFDGTGAVFHNCLYDLDAGTSDCTEPIQLAAGGNVDITSGWVDGVFTASVILNGADNPTDLPNVWMAAEVNNKFGDAVRIGIVFGQYQWENCPSGPDLVVYGEADSNRPTDNFAWVLSGGVYVKAKFKASTGAAAGANPCSVEMATTATQCSDLTYAAFSDDFDDNSINTCKWNNNLGSPTESGGKMNWSSTGPDVGFRNSDFPNESGDFSATVDWTIVFNEVAGRTGINGNAIIMRSGGSPIDISIQLEPDDDYLIKARVGGGESQVVVSASDTSGKFRIRRISGTVDCQYDIGAGFVTARSVANSDVTNEVRVYGFNDGPNGGTASGTFDNLILTGG